MKKTKVLFASSEVEPFAKTGGLADVAASLPKALCGLGHDVRVIMPKYKNIPMQYVEKMEKIGEIGIYVSWRQQYCGILKLEMDKVTYYFIDNEYYFGRDGYYGYFDEAERFAFFCKALLEILPVIDFKPDIIHCNDWQTGVVSLFLNAWYRNSDFYRDIKTVFTIHNLKYQGVFPKEVLGEVLGVSWEYFHADGIEFFDKVNYLKAGLVYSNIITTVSKTYAEEIKSDFFGENLNNVLNKRSNDLYGILNGIDMERNDPAVDDRIFANYSKDNLEGKLTNKQMLQKSLGLQERIDIPLIGLISRLVDQKGFDLIDCVMDEILKMDIQFVLLGAGEYRYEQMFKYYQEKYPGKISVNLKYDALLSQRIYAGADMFLMPSLFEPCGLSQMFSLRYGTIPIVRETGGLKDTIAPYNDITHEGNGFTFSRYNAHDMLYAIKEAVHFYYHRATWTHLMKKGMSIDFSWEKSAKEYLDVYKKLVAN
ncbi:glycogen synthase GlgA [Acetivibrio mesophilus]|uniref:Glycogen synthase n=1 Tax=Acetivibrio mesophilus TaxID=2487273 RepID=A0A4Q0I5H9_9FIRM|nr:glycogen synthase GlgA [Acetivibrio mesophilus]ODM25875.1 starch synthase [Clostridium sp. Bc-iso-3]RXE59541.1 glycogen synthase GlgA [Acetivibrio mesophilus]HHV30750.1 glycogen synthase GlgA [Clostridium sp.]